ncbi:hypothetical protein D3C72_1307500 [compost metagenome]
MAAARPFGVEGMDGAVTDGRQGVFDTAGFVEGVGVNRHLHVQLLGNGQAAVNCSGRRAPVLMQFQAYRTRVNLLAQGFRLRGVALAQQANIDRQLIGSLEHTRQVPRPGGAGGGVGARSRTGAAPDKGRDPRNQRFLHLLRADEVDVRVNAACRDDLALGGNDFGAWANGQGHARLDVRVAGLAHAEDAPVLYPDVGLDDAPMVDDQRIGQHQVHRLGSQHLSLAHAVADDLAAAEFDLFTIDREVLFHRHP